MDVKIDVNPQYVEQIERENSEFKNWLNGMLHSEAEKVIVKFKKTDGTEREMTCTLVESRIPEEKRPNGKNPKFSDEACRVFDLDKKDWRSFRWDSLISVNVEVY